MKLSTLLLITGTILLRTSLAQTSYSVSSFNETQQEFKYLLLKNSQISQNDTINETILDLVEPNLKDSVVTLRKQHHRLFLVGWLIHAFGGYNWRAVDRHKEKFVGTVTHSGRSGGFEFTEYDIKFHLQFHLKKYLWKEFRAYDRQKKLKRQDVRPSHRTDYKVPPFIRDTNQIDSKIYTIGCELTPPPAAIAPLNYQFFPTQPHAGSLKDHVNFETDHPSMGFYGVWCLDCNHNCHPEMHPYEWVWWLKATDKDTTYDKTWLVGLFHEGSNRFRNWSKNPMTGNIKIPFAVTVQSGVTNVINIDHLVFNNFKEKRLEGKEQEVPSFSPRENYQPLNILHNDSVLTQMQVYFNYPVSTTGLKYWLSSLNYDAKSGVLSGYLHFATSVVDLYTTRIKFSKQYGE